MLRSNGFQRRFPILLLRSKQGGKESEMEIKKAP